MACQPFKLNLLLYLHIKTIYRTLLFTYIISIVSVQIFRNHACYMYISNRATNVDTTNLQLLWHPKYSILYGALILFMVGSSQE